MVAIKVRPEDTGKSAGSFVVFLERGDLIPTQLWALIISGVFFSSLPTGYMISLHKAISIMKLRRLRSCRCRPGSVHTENNSWD